MAVNASIKIRGAPSYVQKDEKIWHISVIFHCITRGMGL